MFAKTAIVLFLACAFCAGTTAEVERKLKKFQESAENAQSALRACGRELSELRENICYGFQAMMLKRSGLNKERVISPWSYDGQSNGLSVSGTKGKRGFVDDCCYQECTINQILDYC